MYAVVTTGGKQVKVAQGDVVRVEKLDAGVGDLVGLDNVSLVAKDDGLVVDRTALENAQVVCQVIKQGLGKKVRVFKMKRRKGYRRNHGHRQPFTELLVREISA